MPEAAKAGDGNHKDSWPRAICQWLESCPIHTCLKLDDPPDHAAPPPAVSVTPRHT